MQRDQEQERKETPEEQLATPHALIAPSPQTLVEKQKSAEGLPSSLESKRYYRTLTFTTAQIFWTIQPNGLADSTSMWGAYTGQTEEELKGTGWMEAIHPDDREILRQKWKEVRAAKGILAIEYRVRRHDGIYRTFAVQGIPVFTKEGKYTRMGRRQHRYHGKERA
jgi:PAS domain S-box-containing protein